MSKTNPIGVRFDSELLEDLASKGLADSPQRVLNYLTDQYFKKNVATQNNNVATNAINNVATTQNNVATNDLFDLNAIPKPKLRKSVDYYIALKRDMFEGCDDPSSLKVGFLDILNEDPDLSDKQKQLIINA